MVPPCRDRWPDCRRTAFDVHRDGTWFRSTDEIESSSGRPSVSPATPGDSQQRHRPPRAPTHPKRLEPTKVVSPVWDQRPTSRDAAHRPAGQPIVLCAAGGSGGQGKSSVRTAAAVGGRRATLQGSLNRRKRLALRSPKPSGRSGHALLLHANQVPGGYNSPTSMVSRRPLAPGGGASHSRQHHRRLSHL